MQTPAMIFMRFPNISVVNSKFVINQLETNNKELFIFFNRINQQIEHHHHHEDKLMKMSSTISTLGKIMCVDDQELAVLQINHTAS